jgi:hypothetical protein
VNLWYVIQEEQFEKEFPQFLNRIQIRSTDTAPHDSSTDFYIFQTPVNV